MRLREVQEQEFEASTRRSLAKKQYVYLWVDSVHVNVRPTREPTCILVVIGATKDGERGLLAVHDGVREGEGA